MNFGRRRNISVAAGMRIIGTHRGSRNREIAPGDPCPGQKGPVREMTLRSCGTATSATALNSKNEDRVTEERTSALLVVEDDPAAQRIIIESVARAGCVPLVAANCAEARRLFDQQVAGVIADLHLPDGSILDLVRTLRSDGRNIPIVVVSSDREFAAKIEAIRAGADAYLEKPLDPEVLTRAIGKLTQAREEQACILVVEDDPVSARATRAILESAGFRVRVLSDAMQFEQEMLAFKPHVVVMDIELPGVSGVDLTRFLRQDPRFETVPVIYLTGTMTTDAAFEAAASGGENVLQKPPQPEMLVSAVRARLRHFGRLREMMDRDPLTGALMRRAFFDRAAEAVALASRQATSIVTLVALDVDHFKAINDQHGHAAGDHVLGALGEMLRHVLRTTDVVGRTGGEEFAMLLPGADAMAAKQLVERLLAEFSSQPHEGKGGVTFRVTFSAGVVQLAKGTTLDAWMAAADAALYRSKGAGRARVVVATVTPPVDGSVVDETAIERLAAVGGDGDLVREVIRLFEESVPGYLAALRAASLARDVKQAGDAAHALRSSCGNAGARKMAALCASIESAAKAGEWDAAEEAIAKLAATFPETLAELRRVHSARRQD